MSDVMLLGVLRMPMPDEPDTLTLRQFVSRAREAADRIEADADELARLRAKFGEAADKAMTYAASYEMAVARLVLALDHMHPEQKRALNDAWSAKRAELRALKA